MRLFLIILLSTLLFLHPSFSLAENKVIEITVEKKNTLNHLCKIYLDEPELCWKIAKLNRLSNPHLIFPGQTIKFPVELLKGEPIEGEVTFLSGDAAVSENGKEPWKKLQTGEHIKEGSFLRTESDSSLEVSFEDGSTFLLKPDTLMRLESVKKKPSGFAMKFLLQAGRVIAKIKSSTGRVSRFEIYTPSAVAVVRGTEYRVSLDPKISTMAEVLEGKVNIASSGSAVTVKKGEGTVVKRGSPPAKPKKLLQPPAPTELLPLYRAFPLQLRFDLVNGASSYRVMLSRDIDAKDITKELKIKPHETFELFSAEDGAYYLTTTSIDPDNLEGLSSKPKEIKIRINPLPPLIQAPVHRTRLRERIVEVKWLKVKDAANYHLQISEDREFNNIVLDKSDLKDTSLAPVELDNKRYYLRMSSVANDGYEGVWSVVQEFEIVPGQVKLVNIDEANESAIAIRWADMGKGVNYQVQMSKNEEFKEILIDERVTKPEVSLKKPSEPGTYYVRVRAIASDGSPADFSKPQSFEIKESFPYEAIGAFSAFIILIIIIF